MSLNKLSKFHKDLGIATIASTISFIMSLGLAPVMTRYYTPSDYGTFAVINNIATFIATAILFSLPNALPMESSLSKKIRLLKVLFHLAFFAFFITITTTVLYFLFYFMINSSTPNLAFLLLPILVLSISLHRISQGWANSDGDFSAMASARVAHPLIAKPFTILAGILTTSHAIYIVFFEIVGYLSQFYLMVRDRWNQLTNIGKLLSKNRLKLTIGIIKEYYDFSLYLNLVNLLTLGFITMQTIVITINYSSVETGLFSLAISMISLPIQLIGMATASIIYHKLIHIADKTPQILFKSTLNILLGYMILGALPYIIIYFYGDELFGFVFGKQWIQSGTIASILALPLFLQFMTMPISSIFRVTKTIKLQFIINIWIITPNMIIFYFASYFQTFYEAVKILSIVMSISGIVIIIYSLYISWKYSQNSLVIHKDKI